MTIVLQPLSPEKRRVNGGQRVEVEAAAAEEEEEEEEEEEDKKFEQTRLQRQFFLEALQEARFVHRSMSPHGEGRSAGVLHPVVARAALNMTTAVIQTRSHRPRQR